MGNEKENRQQELARLMLKKAQQDFDAAKTFATSDKVADEIVGFHAQQAIEKTLKAVLTRAGLNSKSMTHQEFLSLLCSARAEWEEALNEVGEERMTQIVYSEWTVKDLIAHVAWFVNQMVGVLKEWVRM
jgi:HEPN domain-containing protein